MNKKFKKSSMDIYSPPGTKVVYANPTAGWPGDQEFARKFLKFGETYTVRAIDVHSCHSDVYLEEVKDKTLEGFNSVLFEELYKEPEIETIYLAGGIAGLSDSECNDWRDEIMSRLDGKYLFKNPMVRDFRGRYREEFAPVVVEGDYKDIRESDIFLARVHTPSWGTAMEIPYAYEKDKFVILICNSESISPWLHYHGDVIVSNEDEAIDFLIKNYERRNSSSDTNCGII